MGSAKITYDPEMRKSDHGSRLYGYWKRVKGESNSKEFKTFPGFYNWAMANGYFVGAKLARHDEEKPYSPANCYWIPKGQLSENSRDYDWEALWDETVNRIRLHYGMDPIYS